MRKKIISTLFMICIMLLLSPKRAEASEGTYVAQINENQYETLQEAVEEASGTYPIILLEDITLSEAILIQKSSNITLDLNGKTIDGGACEEYAIKYVSSNRDLTIRDSFGNGMIIGGIEVGEGSVYGRLKLDSGILTNSNNGPTINIVKGQVTINGGQVIHTSNGDAINFQNGKLYVNGGIVEANTGVAINNEYGNEFDIKGSALITSANTDRGTIFQQNQTDIKEHWTVLDVKGGTIKNTAANGVAIQNLSLGQVVISDIPSGDKAVISGGACVMNTAPIIKGYTVKISASDTYVNGTGLSLFSRVGFADNITNYKYIKIEKGPDNVAKIGSTNYTTLQAAFSAASNNQTIQLIEEIYNVNSVNIATDNNNNITLDLNGKAIIVEVPAIIHEGKGTLTITDNTGGEGRICTSIGYYSPLPIHLKGGSLSVTGGILDGGFYTAIKNEGTGSISVSGGTVKSSSSSYSPTIYSSQGGKITISGNATIISAFIYESSDISAIYQTGGNPDDTVIEITGGTIENISDFGYAIYARNTGNIVVSGGSIIAKKYSAIRAYYKDG